MQKINNSKREAFNQVVFQLQSSFLYNSGIVLKYMPNDILSFFNKIRLFRIFFYILVRHLPLLAGDRL